jgi:Na+/H+ antiporter NhaD/arsenite permease-like protein
VVTKVSRIVIDLYSYFPFCLYTAVCFKVIIGDTVKMVSPLYDVEKHLAPDAIVTNDPVKMPMKKASSLRTWGPAMVAVAVVLAVNVALLGPTGGQIPALSETHQNFKIAAEERTRAVLDMDSHWKDDLLIGRQIGSRNLSHEEGGVMEYTRRRHRHLTEYVFVDVSGEFSSFGKWSVTVIYFAYWVFLMFPNWFLPIGRPGIALGGGLSMVVYRYILQMTGNGPFFDAIKVIILEPLFLLFGLMLTTIYLEKMERGGLFDKLRESLDDAVNWKRVAKIMTMSTIGSAAVMNDSVVLIFSGVVVDLCVRHKVADSIPYLLALATTSNIGSALTMTGNPQNILIVSLAYDDISWIAFATDMVLPVIAATFINAVMMFMYYGKELFPGSSGIMENWGIMFFGNRTPEMLAQEHAYYARQAVTEEMKRQEEEEKAAGWTLWSKIQVLVVCSFLVCFAVGLDVSVVSISAGSILMVIAAYKRQHYDPRPIMMEYDAE